MTSFYMGQHSDSHVYLYASQYTCDMDSIIIGVSSFLDLVNYSYPSCVGVGDKLGVMERVVTRLPQEREDLVKTMEDFSLAAQRWSDLEQQQLSHSIKKMGSCMENCATAVTDLVGGKNYV